LHYDRDASLNLNYVSVLNNLLLTLNVIKYKQLYDKEKQPPTKVLLQAWQTQRSISSSNAIQLQFQRDGTQVSISNKHQQIIINLASVSADTALLPRLQAIPKRWL